jgi:hypothetical protein
VRRTARAHGRADIWLTKPDRWHGAGARRRRKPRVSQDAGTATRATPGQQQLIPAEMDQRNGLPHDPLKPAQLHRSSSTDRATAHFRGHVAVDAYAPVGSVDVEEAIAVHASSLRRRHPPMIGEPAASGARPEQTRAGHPPRFRQGSTAEPDACPRPRRSRGRRHRHDEGAPNSCEASEQPKSARAHDRRSRSRRPTAPPLAAAVPVDACSG